MLKRSRIPLISILILMATSAAHADGSWISGCYQQFRNLFEARSSKKDWINAPGKKQLELSESRNRIRKVDLVDKGPEAQVVSSAPMNRLLSDPTTRLGQIAQKLKEQGTAVVLYPRRFGPKGAFVDFRVKGDATNQNGVIILNPKARGLTDARALLGHEAYHAKMQAKRARGEKDLFNSQFHSKTETGGIYDQYVSSEEIHAWSKEFIQVAVTADHGKTVTAIRSRMKAMTDPLTDKEKMDRILLRSRSVISPTYRKFIGEYRIVLEAHQAFLGRMRQALESGEFKLKFGGQNRAILETDDLVYQADNFIKLPNGSADLFSIQKELLELQKINSRLNRQIDIVSEMMSRADQQGTLTATEYVRLKNELSRFGSLVTDRSGK